MPVLTPGIKLLLLINVGVFIVTFAFGTNLGDGQTLGYFLALRWDGLLDGFGLGLLRFVTYQFAHSYQSPFHLLLNMLVLYFFGTMVESEVGRRGVIRLYLQAGAIGGALQLLLALVFGAEGMYVIGASGSCYGIMVYAAMMAPRMRVIFIVFPMELRWLVGVLVFVGLYETVLMIRGDIGSGGVAHGAHLGGALWGYIAFRWFRTRLITADHRPNEFAAKFRAWRERRARASAADRAGRLDEILDKVRQQGMAALTASERRFLESESKSRNRE